MSKLAVEAERAIRKVIKLGQRGFMHTLENDDGKIIDQHWIRSCYCLSKGLFKKPTKCPTHRKTITQ